MNKIVFSCVVFLTACSNETPKEKDKVDVITPSKNALEIVDGVKLGIDFKHDAAFSDVFSIYEPLGSGIAVIDYDNDGDMDIFIPQYGALDGYSKLYENNNMQFSDVTRSAGLSHLKDLIFASVADSNNDGFDDILVGGKNTLSLWINQGDSTFKKSDMVVQSKGRYFYTAASWFDMNRDGYLDVWIANYVDDSIVAHCKSANGNVDYCPPKSYQSLADVLFVNQHGESFNFLRIDQSMGKTSPALGVVSDDFDNNGWPDVYVANDGVANQLFYNFEGKLSSDHAKNSGVAFNLMGASEASMGIAVGDVDNNSFIDLYVTHFKGETNTLYLNSNGIFTDNTAFYKLVQHVRPLTGFGVLFNDYNADNLLDIIAVNGSTQYSESLADERLEGEPIQFWKNSRLLKFNYDKVNQDTLKPRVGRGLVSVDLDNDGDYDFIISNNNQPISVIINKSDPDDWIGITVKCNKRTDYGARIHLSKQSETQNLYRTVHADGSYASSIDPRILIYKSKQYDTLDIKWSASQKTEIYSLKKLNKNSYNLLNCKT